MKGYTKWFILASILYLVLGTLLGTLFFFLPALLALKPVHAHLNLLGFLSMMVYGVLYHVLPRFLARPLYSERLAWFHVIAGNITFVLLLGLMALGYGGGIPEALAWAKWAALSHWLTLLAFAYNILQTIRLAPS